MPAIKIIVCAFLLGQISFCSVAQDDKTITGDFKDLTFTDFVNQIEKDTKYKFYYNPAWIDSLKINLSVLRKTVPETLDELFQNTELRYAIDKNYSVYISIGQSLMTDLPLGFFNDGEQLKTQKNSNQDYSPYGLAVFSPIV